MWHLNASHFFACGYNVTTYEISENFCFDFEFSLNFTRSPLSQYAVIEIEQQIFMNFLVSIIWIVTMAETVQLFKIVRKLFIVFGIYPSPSNRPKSPLNVRNVVALLWSFAMCISSFAFLILKVDNFQDFGATFYTSMTEISCMIGFLSIVFETQSIFQIIDKIDGMIGKSESVKIEIKNVESCVMVKTFWKPFEN